MPLTEALFRPRRLKMRGWTRKRLEWQIKTAHVLEVLPVAMEPGQDKFAQLELMKGVALACARQVLGETGDRIRDLIQHHSPG